MRVNQFVARATGLSRRQVDSIIEAGRIKVNNQLANVGQQINDQDRVTLDDKVLNLDETSLTITLNKPKGYVVSRNGQGNKTIYDLLPARLHHLKSVGRLDKNSSGLLLLTNDGLLTHKLTHPSFQKTKIYEVRLDKKLAEADFKNIDQTGVVLEDGLSRLKLHSLKPSDDFWQVTMHEGRNRQIRRTFEALGYRVVELHRIKFGDFDLGKLDSGKFKKQ